MKYTYVGYSLDAGIVKGRVEADNEALARTEMTDQGYKLLEVRLAR
jgi:type II secretory pathway component PulF